MRVKADFASGLLDFFGQEELVRQAQQGDANSDT
jgi:hypothetical protein